MRISRVWRASRLARAICVVLGGCHVKWLRRRASAPLVSVCQVLLSMSDEFSAHR